MLRWIESEKIQDLKILRQCQGFSRLFRLLFYYIIPVEVFLRDNNVNLLYRRVLY